MAGRPRKIADGSAKSASRPIVDRAAGRYVIRWVAHDGSRHNSTAPTREEASAIRARLLGAPAPEPVSESAESGSVPVIGTSDSLQSWANARVYARNKLLQALQSDDVDLIEARTKAASAISTLSRAAAADRPMGEIEGVVDQVESRVEELTQSRKHGTRVRAAAESKAKARPALRRDDAVY